MAWWAAAHHLSHLGGEQVALVSWVVWECRKEVVAKEETSSRSVVRCGSSWRLAQCPSCLGPADIAQHHHKQLEDSKKTGWNLCLNQASYPVWASCFTQKTGTGLALIKAGEHVRSGVCEGRLTMNCPAHSSFNAQRSTSPCQAGF